MGMAFTDTLLAETDATVAIVDRRGRPGGHWNTSYPHVRLHQPSAFYGVNSRALGSGKKDSVGFNSGLYELASGTEVVTYFDQVMQQDFLPSGRVQYFPMTDHVGDGRVRSLVTGDESIIDATTIVDATYMNVTVPSMRPPDFAVADGMVCIPPNDLAMPDVLPAEHHVVVGGGKTAMDACLWLLDQHVDPARITWIRPRDSWCLNRRNIQPGEEFFEHSIGGFVRQIEIAAEATSVDDLFARLEAEQLLLRLDPDVRPTMYRCATVTESEIDALRLITNVVRMGRVQRIDPNEIVMEHGTIPTTAGTVHVDCTADGLERRPVVPVFDGNRITLQAVRTCQQVFSAAFIGHVEAAYDDPAVKNELATVVPHPNTDIDWLRVTLANGMNSARWRSDEDLSAWLRGARLDAFSELRGAVADGGGEAALLLDRMEASAIQAVVKLQEFLAADEQ
ncbi:UNVERIFIED_CONTAM: hypothetical protein GTU68_043027 [Idotea baltica]|nr:hypothetical protein [Idotea baltica]